MSTPAPGPVLRYRSARDLGADPALDPDAALDEALRMRDATGRTQADRDAGRRMLIGLAQRPDLTRPVLKRLCQAIDARFEWTAALALLRSPQYRRMAPVRALVTVDIVPALLPFATEFAEEIIALIGHNADVVRGGYRGKLVEDARAALGENRINAVLDGWLRAGGTRLHDLVQTPLLTAHGWAGALDLLRTASPTSAEHATLLGLSRSPTITADRGLALIDVYDALGVKPWNHLDLLRNPFCPPEVYQRLALHRDPYISQSALAADNCPDEVRFAAALRGHPLGLSKVTSPVPTDVAVKVLADLDRGKAGRRKIQPTEATEIRKALARLDTDPAVTARVLDLFLAAADTPQAGLAAYWKAASANEDRWPGISGDTRADEVLRMLAANPNGRVRAFVVGHLWHADDVLAAMTDPAPEVRAAAVAHPRFPEDRLPQYATDPSPVVRAAVGERFLAAIDRPLPTRA